jgi:dihydroorotate dehydrogenase
MDEWNSELGVTSPWMNAAGFGGFMPMKTPHVAVRMGAFVTNPISLLPRNPARERHYLPYTGGFLMHTGYPNPGLRRVLQGFAPKWRSLSVPVWVHLLADQGRDLQQMARSFEGVENVAAIEIGFPPGLSTREQVNLVSDARGELPLFICLALDDLNPSVLEKLPGLGVTGLVVSAPRGAVIFHGRQVTGRLYGPALHPQLLAALSDLRGYELPVLAGCGVYSVEQGQAALACDAAGIQIDGWYWKF